MRSRFWTYSAESCAPHVVFPPCHGPTRPPERNSATVSMGPAAVPGASEDLHPRQNVVSAPSSVSMFEIGLKM